MLEDKEIKVLAAKPEDAKELLEIYAPYVENTAISFEYIVPSVDEFRDRIKNISAKYPYLKALDKDGIILGYAYAGNFKARAAYDWAVETTIYVRKDMKRSSVGRALYQTLEKSLQSMGILNLNACIAYVDEDDEYLTNDSMYFHERLGYSYVGKFHKCGRKFGKWYDMIWMEKLLGEHADNQEPVRFGEWTI